MFLLIYLQFYIHYKYNINIPLLFIAALYTSTCLKPILMHDNFEESDDIMDELEGTDTGKESMLRKYSNPNLKRVLKPRLKFMDKQGMLD